MNSFTSPRLAALYIVIMLIGWVSYENYMITLTFAFSVVFVLSILYGVTVIYTNRWVSFKEFKEIFKL